MTDEERAEWREKQRLDGVPPPRSLRDDFAMAALAGLCAFPGRADERNGPDHFARWAYALADAMMDERR